MIFPAVPTGRPRSFPTLDELSCRSAVPDAVRLAPCLLETLSLMDRIELIATAAFGLEAVVSRELAELGYNEQTVEDGRVAFMGDPLAICRTNLWLRSADRILVKVVHSPPATSANCSTTPSPCRGTAISPSTPSSPSAEKASAR